MFHSTFKDPKGASNAGISVPEWVTAAKRANTDVVARQEACCWPFGTFPCTCFCSYTAWMGCINFMVKPIPSPPPPRASPTGQEQPSNRHGEGAQRRHVRTRGRWVGRSVGRLAKNEVNIQDRGPPSPPTVQTLNQPQRASLLYSLPYSFPFTHR